MNELVLIGLNHKTASVEIREKLYYTLDEARPILPELVHQYLKEGVLLSTCNRTELVGVVETENEKPENIINYLIEHKSAQDTISNNHFYTQHSFEAVRHIFEVAAGIDSLLVGEDQILKQVKEAYELAVEKETAGTLMHHMFHSALRVGKRARTETKISDGAVSISYAAVELSEKIFADLSKKKALLIGAGETAELSAKNLFARGVTDITIANRTLEKAEKLASEFKGKAIPLEAITEKLRDVDIVISSINTPDFILTSQQIKKAMTLRSSKPLLIIDIGVPRNIEPSVREIENVFLDDMDSLELISHTNRERRIAEIPKVQKIIEEELRDFIQWYQSLDITPTIKMLRDRFEEIRTSEIEKNRNKLSSSELEKVDMVTKSIINKILHTPTVSMKEINGQTNFDTRTMNMFVKHLFGLKKKNVE
ncbi:MAG: glutamyl-tRNA reductase [Ignavibacteria bacterium]|nr:glutamyl-tRNA reductase [Ignavibacteria bacterium]